MNQGFALISSESLDPPSNNGTQVSGDDSDNEQKHEEQNKVKQPLLHLGQITSDDSVIPENDVKDIKTAPLSPAQAQSDYQKILDAFQLKYQFQETDSFQQVIAKIKTTVNTSIQQFIAMLDISPTHQESKILLQQLEGLKTILFDQLTAAELKKINLATAFSAFSDAKDFDLKKCDDIWYFAYSIYARNLSNQIANEAERSIDCRIENHFHQITEQANFVLNEYEEKNSDQLTKYESNHFVKSEPLLAVAQIAHTMTLLYQTIRGKVLSDRDLYILFVPKKKDKYRYVNEPTRQFIEELNNGPYKNYCTNLKSALDNIIDTYYTYTVDSKQASSKSSLSYVYYQHLCGQYDNEYRPWIMLIQQISYPVSGSAQEGSQRLKRLTNYIQEANTIHVKKHIERSLLSEKCKPDNILSSCDQIVLTGSKPVKNFSDYAENTLYLFPSLGRIIAQWKKDNTLYTEPLYAEDLKGIQLPAFPPRNESVILEEKNTDPVLKRAEHPEFFGRLISHLGYSHLKEEVDPLITSSSSDFFDEKHQTAFLMVAHDIIQADLKAIERHKEKQQQIIESLTLKTNQSRAEIVAIEDAKKEIEKAEIAQKRLKTLLLEAAASWNLSLPEYSIWPPHLLDPEEQSKKRWEQALKYLALFLALGVGLGEAPPAFSGLYDISVGDVNAGFALSIGLYALVGGFLCNILLGLYDIQDLWKRRGNSKLNLFTKKDGNYAENWQLVLLAVPVFAFAAITGICFATLSQECILDFYPSTSLWLSWAIAGWDGFGLFLLFASACTSYLLNQRWEEIILSKDEREKLKWYQLIGYWVATTFSIALSLVAGITSYQLFLEPLEDLGIPSPFTEIISGGNALLAWIFFIDKVQGLVNGYFRPEDTQNNHALDQLGKSFIYLSIGILGIALLSNTAGQICLFILGGSQGFEDVHIPMTQTIATSLIIPTIILHSGFPNAFNGLGIAKSKLPTTRFFHLPQEKSTQSLSEEKQPLNSSF